jgi:amidase
MVPIALGTQTGGSTIRPAAFCGVIGFKPSFNMINRAGLKFAAESLDTIGVIARTVEDVALFTHAVSATALPDFNVQPDTRARVGLCRTATWDIADEATHEKLELAAATLAKKGAHVSEFTLGEKFAQIYEDHAAIVDYESVRGSAYEYENHREQLSATLARQLESGWNVTRERYEGAQRNAVRYRQLLSEMLRDYDFLLTPSAPGEAPHGVKSTGNSIFNRCWTLLGVPCVTVPAYQGPHGLPIGVQVVGDHGSDVRTLQWAHWVHRALA